ncbi:MAG: hypothetical protein EON49_01365 [Acidovorax sp.]|nr:MAG: hypothetical protein EON49_01365 [Acidovorax sp.]
MFWTFFDQDSNHVTDGCFPLTPKDTHAFVWSAQSGVGLEGKRGYLVFAAGLAAAPVTVANACQAANSAAQDPAALITASAFQIDLAGKDVAYTPVIDGPLVITGDLSTMGPANLVSAAGALNVGPGPVATPSFSMRYFVDGVVDSGADTRVVVWSTGSQKGTHTVNMYNDAQERKSVNFKLNFAELDFFDPETIIGRPAAFVDGFIEWAPVAALPADYTPATGDGSLFVDGGSVFTYSVINAPAFGAAQTILGAHTN